MQEQYSAPVDDYVFLLTEVLPKDSGAGDALACDELRELLNQASRFFSDVWQPLYAVGDREGCHLENGVVRTPTGFPAAYRAYCEAGWNQVGVPTSLGGAGLPDTVNLAVREMANGSNSALALYSGLTMAAQSTLERTGEDWMRAHIVPHMVAGDWTGTMCLTEPHCGTDLKLMRTRATALEDGTYRINGTKIFISGGDHDLSENIVHLVLAKLPDDSGQYADDLSTVSLFMVPKVQVGQDDGKLGARNGVVAGGIEHKMGLKGNATCTLHFEDAVGYRLGSTSASGGTAAGMSGMFAMMNRARLGTGMQALASAHIAYTKSAAYARERRAGKAANPKDRTQESADPITLHPDVRRLLIKQAAFIESARALGLWVTQILEQARATDDTTEENRLTQLASFLTPVIKAYFSDRAYASSNDALQLLGGHGYIVDNEVEQVVRDARIFQLYEGANGVQAFDLVARKLPADGQSGFTSFIEHIRIVAMATPPNPILSDLSEELTRLAEDTKKAAEWILDRDHRSPYDLGAASYPFLNMVGLLACGMMWLKMGSICAHKLAQDPSQAFYKRKLVLARYWLERELPAFHENLEALFAGADGLMEIPESDL